MVSSVGSPARASCTKGGGVFARIGGVQAFLVGQDDQQIGFDQVGHQGTQGVVVAKLDLVVDDRVVFVDDRQHAVLQQGEQGGAGIEVAFAVSQIGVRQQHLGAAHAVFTQLGFVHLRQAHLPNSSRRLQGGHFARAGGPAQALHAFGNRAAGHHDHFFALGAEQRHLAAPFANRPLVQTATFVGHQAGANFDDDAARIAQEGGNGGRGHAEV